LDGIQPRSESRIHDHHANIDIRSRRRIAGQILKHITIIYSHRILRINNLITWNCLHQNERHNSPGNPEKRNT